MGEITELILDGILCERCGGLVGSEPHAVGYPRLCEFCRAPKRRRKTHKGRRNRLQGGEQVEASLLCVRETDPVCPHEKRKGDPG